MKERLSEICCGTSAGDPTVRRLPKSFQTRISITKSIAAVAFCLALMIAASAGTTAKGDEAVGAGDDIVLASHRSFGPVEGLENLLTRICPVRYNLPADVFLRLPSPLGQAAFDRYSWSTFLALAAPEVGAHVNRNGDNRTQWDDWSSTVDLIQCNLDPTSCVCPDGDCTRSGSRYYPPECQEVADYKRYRVLDQQSKVDDSFLESAQTNENGTPVGGLGNSPVIDKNGNFLRYEILVSPATYNFVVAKHYYDNADLQGLDRSVTFPCGELDYRGGDPANERLGALWIKNAWMELSGGKHGRKDENDDDYYDHDDGADYDRDEDHDDKRHSKNKDKRNLYHTEKVLVYTPSYRNLDGKASCELRTLGLVGQHGFHKTEKQIRGIWYTFEHKDNAPDCTALPLPGDMGGAGPSKACPASIDKSYNFYPEKCSADGSDPVACQTCNTPPVSNAPADAPEGACINPNIADSEKEVAFCLDQPPAPIAGTSKACRQVPVVEYYPTANRLNKSCARQLGRKSVWSNYQLISTMYYDLDNDLGCRTIGELAARPGETLRVLQRPLVPVGPGRDNPMEAPRKPFLANTSMETYVRSDCMGCHSGATVKDADGNDTVGTDFAYWLQLEVPAGGAIDVPNPHN